MAKQTVSSAAGKVKATVTGSGGGAGGEDGEAGSAAAAAGSTDIRTTLTSLLTAVEDVVHQLAEHKRVVEVCSNMRAFECVAVSMVDGTLCCRGVVAGP